MIQAKKKLEEAGLIPVLRAPSKEAALALVDAMVAGGVTVMEVTMTVPGAMDLLRELKATRGDQLLLGSGTVTTASEAQETILAGAEFVVSPSLHPEVIAVTREMGKVSIPGALTPTEAITAWKCGADYVKIFPCSAVGGAGYLKALHAPFPEMKLIPTGGVKLQNAAEFLRAGACALGVGADLVNTLAIAEGRPELITVAARAYIEVIQRHRSTLAGR